MSRLELLSLDKPESIILETDATTPQGKRKMVDGFIRWCKKADVGLSQKILVESVADEEPTGLMDDFYVQTGR